MWFARFQILIFEPHSIWPKLLVLSLPWYWGKKKNQAQPEFHPNKFKHSILFYYSRVQNKHTGTLIDFWGFSRGYVLFKRGYVYLFWFFKNLLRILNFLFIWLCIKESNCLLFKRGLRLFKGLCLLFLSNVPGAMFIQGGMFIPDSRVLRQFIDSEF